ncbi:uncharacterized protein METZ01_LOCUS322165, partial [marine metagenome]
MLISNYFKEYNHYTCLIWNILSRLYIMKMHHLDEDEVKEIMEKIQNAVKEEELAPNKIEEIFKLSKVDSENFL